MMSGIRVTAIASLVGVACAQSVMPDPWNALDGSDITIAYEGGPSTVPDGAIVCTDALAGIRCSNPGRADPACMAWAQAQVQQGVAYGVCGSRGPCLSATSIAHPEWPMSSYGICGTAAGCNFPDEICWAPAPGIAPMCVPRCGTTRDQ
jgi:hypothetical protein